MQVVNRLRLNEQITAYSTNTGNMTDVHGRLDTKYGELRPGPSQRKLPLPHCRFGDAHPRHETMRHVRLNFGQAKSGTPTATGPQATYQWNGSCGTLQLGPGFGHPLRPPICTRALSQKSPRKNTCHPSTASASNPSWDSQTMRIICCGKASHLVPISGGAAMARVHWPNLSLWPCPYSTCRCPAGSLVWFAGCEVQCFTSRLPDV